MNENPLFKFVSLGSAYKEITKETNFIPVKYDSNQSEFISALLSEANEDKQKEILSAREKLGILESWGEVGIYKNELKEWMSRESQSAFGDVDKLYKVTQELEKKLAPLKKNITALWESLYVCHYLPEEHSEKIITIVEMLKYYYVTKWMVVTTIGVDEFESAYSQHVVVLNSQSLQNRWEKPKKGKKPKTKSLKGIFQERKNLIDLKNQVAQLELAKEQQNKYKSPSFGSKIKDVKSIYDKQGLDFKVKSMAKNSIISLNDLEADITNRLRSNFSTGLQEIKLYNKKAKTKVKVSDYVFALNNKDTLEDLISGGSVSIFPGNIWGDSDSEVDGPAYDLYSEQTIESLGTGTLYVVEEDLDHYEFTDVSHIENVMKGESKSRTFLSSIETDEYTESEVFESTEIERDNQVNESYSLDTEVTKELDTSFNTNASMSVTAKYGVVNIGANASFGFSANTSLSKTSAKSFSKDILSRSVEKVSTQTRELRTYRVKTKTVDRSKHAFDNTGGDGHVRGIYRWLDKVSNIKLWDYGEREFYQFSVPEPASIYRELLEQKYQLENAYLPEYPDFTPSDITLDNYYDLCLEYRVQDIVAPPKKEEIISVSLTIPSTGEGASYDNSTLNTWRSANSSELNVPAGFKVYYATADITSIGAGKKNDNHQEIWVTIGNDKERVGPNDIDAADIEGHQLIFDKDLTSLSNNVPLTVLSISVDALTCVATLWCERTDQALDDWRIEVYQSILESYDRLKVSYDQEKANSESQQTSYKLQDLTPSEKEKLVLAELKRGCIDILTKGDYKNYLSVRDTEYELPEILYNRAIKYGKYIEYFETCFEWDQMTYAFFPYYWSRESQWVDQSTTTDSDPVFSNFLSSGACRLIVPVRKGYEKSLRNYIDSGSIIESLDLPILDLEDYFALEESYQRPDEDKQLVDEWQVKYPTDLVYVQDADEASAIISEEEDVE